MMETAPRPCDPAMIGLVSDTHGLLRPEALDALRGCTHLVHAGDVGSPDVLAALGAIAPVTAVRGNNDRGPWADALPESVTVECGGLRLHVVHDIADLAIDPVAAGVHAVIAGHSHRPRIDVRAGVLRINPGSAGPRRFGLPVAVALLDARAGRPVARIVELTVAARR
jgi:putative phosphoesterase